MKNIISLFFSTKYWNNMKEIEKVTNVIKSDFTLEKVVSVIDGDLSELLSCKEYDGIVIVPCSGSVQPDIIKACEQFENVTLFAAYVEDNFSCEITDKMLCCNAGPTLMDSFGVLKRTKNVTLKKTKEELIAYLDACRGVVKFRNSKIVIVGEPEPWVISVSRNYEDYRDKLGIEIEQVSQDELLEIYKTTDISESKHIYEFYKNNASRILEPTEEDLINSARMAQAIIKLMEKHDCSGIAIACFKLIANSGTNPCVAVSYINGETPFFAACEGDIDSAVTMLLVKSLSDESPWMANPSLQKDNTINFAHCTAPITILKNKRKFILRNHHETGVGVSPQVEYEEGLNVSLFRYSGFSNTLSINTGRSVVGRYEPNCRTQLRIELDDYSHYIRTLIGCHQVIAFEDITKQVQELASLLNIEII